ncbi:MAG: L-aspartate oxidase [Candidatus Paceibacteria bacterium]
MTIEHKLGIERTLSRLHPRHIPSYQFDLIILGGGVAGSLAALTAARRGLEVAVVTKAGLREGNTRYARGGLAAALGEEDTFASHIADTLRCGKDLCDTSIVEHIIRGGPQAVQIVQDLGAVFDRAPSGKLVLSREGGHSVPRIIHARGDSTGVEMQRALTEALRSEARITCFPDTFAIDIQLDGDGHACGIITEAPSGDLVSYCAPNVMLATGGAGQIYRETTNPVVATGDGIAMAARAGAKLRDLEFIQFHPTCLYIAGAARVLISEIVRGAGGRLVDRDGVAFMEGAHVDGDLAPRDVVSRAVARRMVETEDTNVYLDLSNVEGDPHAIFPNIGHTCRIFGMDIARDPIPVRPGAHYHVGGIAVDSDGRTSLPGLWAMGECASTGLHGANRMGSNSLLEGLVTGVRAGEVVLKDLPGRAQPVQPQAATRRWQPIGEPSVDVNIEDLTYSLKSMMWRHMGVERDLAGMTEAVEKIGFWQGVVQDLAEPGLRSWKLLNMLTVARLASISALAREESRGVHFRVDFPDSRDEFVAHTLVTPVIEDEQLNSVQLEHVPVGTKLAAPIS